MTDLAPAKRKGVVVVKSKLDLEREKRKTLTRRLIVQVLIAVVRVFARMTFPEL